MMIFLDKSLCKPLIIYLPNSRIMIIGLFATAFQKSYPHFHPIINGLDLLMYSSLLDIYIFIIFSYSSFLFLFEYKLRLTF